MDEKLHRERRARFCGSARVSLSSLEVDSGQPGREQFTRRKNVERLKNVFTIEGCHRLLLENHVPALICAGDLDASLRASKTLRTALLHPADSQPPRLDFPPTQPLRCLHGRHRLQAAREFLSSGDDWWVVDLYLDEATKQLKDFLREEYSNQSNFSDGEIFRSIRFAQIHKDEFSERKWRARLTEPKIKLLTPMLKGKELRQALDNLLDFPGLWEDFHIGAMRRYGILRCHEELVTYLRRVHRIWSIIAGGDRSVMRAIDGKTVQELELRAPRASTEDAQVVGTGIETQKLFPTVSDPALRDRIKSNVLSIDGFILSLRTFCEDTKYLEPAANAMKRLLEPTFKGTVYRAMRSSFNADGCEPGIFWRQDGERKVVRVRGEEVDRFQFSYRQVWAYAIRHFPSLTNAAPRKEPDRAKPIIQEPKPIFWEQFARLASQTGFSTSRIRQLAAEDALDQAIRDFWRHVAGPGRSAAVPDESLRQIRQILAADDGVPGEQIGPSLTTNDGDQELHRRCGRPFEYAQTAAVEHLFMRGIYGDPPTPRKFITPFFVHRATFHAFFGGDPAVTLDPPVQPVHMPSVRLKPNAAPEENRGQVQAEQSPRIQEMHPSPSRSPQQTGASQEERRSSTAHERPPPIPEPAESVNVNRTGDGTNSDGGAVSMEKVTFLRRGQEHAPVEVPFDREALRKCIRRCTDDRLRLLLQPHPRMKRSFSAWGQCYERLQGVDPKVIWVISPAEVSKQTFEQLDRKSRHIRFHR